MEPNAVKARALVIGSMSFDNTPRDARVVLKLGGVVTYAGLTFLRHGTPTVLVTSIAKADVPKLSVLRDQGLELIVQAGRQTTTFVNEIDGDHRVQFLRAIADPIRWESVERGLEGTELIMVGALHPSDIEEEVLARLLAVGSPVAADIQGYVRRVEGGRVYPSASPLLARVLEVAQYVKADVSEISVAEHALGINEEEIAERFGIDELVVTEGSYGGRIIRPGHAKIRYDAVATVASDPTGAGDVFFAAYLHARRSGQMLPRAAAMRAATVASAQVAGEYLREDLLIID